MGKYPFATLNLKINNLCCDDMIERFKKRELGFSFGSFRFILDGKQITLCPYCNYPLYMNLRAPYDIQIEITATDAAVYRL